MKTNITRPRYPHIFFIGGSPCAGKSSISDVIAQQCGIAVYHVDAMLSEHQHRFTPEKHPMLCKWLSTPWNELWLRPPDVLLDEVITAYREHATFVFSDIEAMAENEPTLIEGNVLIPDDVLRFAGANVNAVWIVPTEAFLRAHYPQRGEWVQAILAACDNPSLALENWMARDAAFGTWILERATNLGLPVVTVDGSQSIEAYAFEVMRILEL